MLTQALVHPYCRRDSILPRFVGFTQENLLLCEQLIGLFHNALDRRESRGQLDENVKAVLAETTRRSLGLGIVKLLEDRTDFSSSSQLDFQTLRKEILDASAQLLRGNDTLPQFGHWEERIREMLPETPLVGNLYGDLPENDRLLKFDDIDARGLLERYNLAQVQALLLTAREAVAGFFQIAVNSGRGHAFMFDIRKFCRTYKLFPIQTDAALKILERAGYIEYDADPHTEPRIMFLLSRQQLYMLNELSPLEERLVTTLLRNYGTLFNDYTYIDEEMIANQAGLTSQQMYLLLKGLTQQRILHFVPRCKTPIITYTRDRVDGVDLIITRDVYEDRKEQFTKRINTVISYATNDDVCRSRQLLRYFDETRSEDCGQCDVCLAHKKKPNMRQQLKDARATITALLSDKKQHHLTELLKLPLPSDILDTALQELVSEEIIHVEDSYIHI